MPTCGLLHYGLPLDLYLQRAGQIRVWKDTLRSHRFPSIRWISMVKHHTFNRFRPPQTRIERVYWNRYPTRFLLLSFPKEKRSLHLYEPSSASCFLTHPESCGVSLLSNHKPSPKSSYHYFPLWQCPMMRPNQLIYHFQSVEVEDHYHHELSYAD